MVGCLPGHQFETWLTKTHFLLQGVDALKLLQVLVLSCNELQRMEGLSGLTNLQHLDLAFNAIKRIEGIRVSPPAAHMLSSVALDKPELLRVHLHGQELLHDAKASVLQLLPIATLHKARLKHLNCLEPVSVPKKKKKSADEPTKVGEQMG